MIIINQDHDEHYNLSTKDIYYRPHFKLCRRRLLFMGWNMYGRIKGQKVLLGTFDTRKACKITMAEIRQHERAGFESYNIPDEADDIDELIREYSGGDASV